MNVEIKTVNNCDPIVRMGNVETTLFSVVKPENEPGAALIFERSGSGFIKREYNDVSRAEMKKEKYTAFYFVRNEKINIDFSLFLFSDMAELLMQTLLKCQVIIEDPVYIAKNNIRDISEDIAQLISEQVNHEVMLTAEEDSKALNQIIKSLPSGMKQVFNDYFKIDNCRLTDMQITDLGRSQKIKTEVYAAMESNDIYSLVQNKEVVDEILDMGEKILRSQIDNKRLKEADVNATLNSENERYDLLTKRYEKLKKSGMIRPDKAAKAFSEALKTVDPVFIEGMKETAAANEPVDTDNIDEKSYFDD